MKHLQGHHFHRRKDKQYLIDVNPAKAKEVEEAIDQLNQSQNNKINFITLSEFFSGSHEKLEQAYDPMVIRFFLLQAHYRSTIDFSNDVSLSIILA